MSEKYEFIAAEKAAQDEAGEKKYSVARMCGWLEVSESGYYEWRERPVSDTAARRARLGELISAVFRESDETYGHRRVHAELVRRGELVSAELVRSLMRGLGLRPCQPRPWRPALTEGGPCLLPDLVRRDFTASRPGTKLVGDITYIPTWQGWVYLATVIDCCTKAVAGYAIDDHYRTPLIEKAIHMAVRNNRIEPGAIFHSDRGSNYTSAAFGETLTKYRIRQSAGRTGICYDNAMAESFFSVLKNERVHRVVYDTKEKAKADIAAYIELRYNSRRLHSELGYRTPDEVRAEHMMRQQAA